MNLTMNKLSALAILRLLRARAGGSGLALRRCELIKPDPHPATRWSAKRLDLGPYAKAVHPSTARPLDVCVPEASARLRIHAARNTVYSQGLPRGSFLFLGDGMCISSPELLFVETAPLMETAAHVMLGYELCGTYTRNHADPRNGDVEFFVPAVTSVARIREFLDTCHNVRGTDKAYENLAYVRDNAWSPTEAIVAAMLELPIWEYGYGLGGVVLNKRVDLGGIDGWPEAEHLRAQSRVPDIVIEGSPIGLNYDGEEHLDLDSVANAAIEAHTREFDENTRRQLEQTMQQVRSKVVDDKRRDRELGSSGLVIMPVTKEDLYQIGRFESLVHLILDGIESHTGRDMHETRSYLTNPALRRKRQELVWSLLPGSRGARISKKLAEERRRRLHH